MKNDKEIRCGHCSRLLAKGEAVRLAVKCPRCKNINLITGSGSKTEKTAKH